MLKLQSCFAHLNCHRRKKCKNIKMNESVSQSTTACIEAIICLNKTPPANIYVSLQRRIARLYAESLSTALQTNIDDFSHGKEVICK